MGPPTTSRTRPPIIALAPNAWNSPWMNRQQVLSRLAARGWQITYSTGALSIWLRGKPIWQETPLFGAFDEQDGLKLDRPGRWLSFWPAMRRWNRFVTAAQARRLRNSVRPACPDDMIAVVCHPDYWPYVERLRPRHVVFYLYDAFNLTPGWTARQQDKFEQLARRADLIVASSEAMIRELPREAQGKARFLPNGADADAFRSGAGKPCPPDLAAIPRPRIGYVGNVTLKVDLASVAEVAARRPDWHWVFVGEIRAVQDDPATRDSYARCIERPNVHFIPSKHHAELPAYVNHMDVNTMCYRQIGGWWTAIYPLKLHEYLAAGRPIVSADIEAVRPFAHVVDIATTPDEWVSAIDRALATGGAGTVEARRAVAFENTWDRRVDKFEEWISSLQQSWPADDTRDRESFASQDLSETGRPLTAPAALLRD